MVAEPTVTALDTVLEDDAVGWAALATPTGVPWGGVAPTNLHAMNAPRSNATPTETNPTIEARLDPASTPG